MLLLWRYAALLYYRWALRCIDPMHPDVGYILHRERELSDQLKEIECTTK